ncbi:MAG: Fur family transcriptional regulator [Terrimesophilobacter sp.]
MALARELRDSGLRVTSGRIALLETLESMPHSDAEALLAELRRAQPALSVQSVHNILHDLSDAGLLRRIEPAGSSSRYERRTGDNHHHLVCTECQAIEDVDCAVGHAPCLTPSALAGYTVTVAEVTFWGLCATCQNHSTNEGAS